MKIACMALLGSLAATAWVQSASAHVTLERNQAPAGSYYKAVLQVAHGCQGSPTVTVRVRIPEGVTSAKPQPKPGWKLSITRVPLAPPMDAGHHHGADEGVSDVVWSGGPLADEHFDEFRILMKLPDRPGTTLYLPVIQECQQGELRWTGQPTADAPAGDIKTPAPALQLTPRP